MIKISIPAGGFLYTLLSPLFDRRCLPCFLACFSFIPCLVSGQTVGEKKDTVLPVHLDEVIVVSAKKRADDPGQSKPLSAVDEYLTSARKVNMIKRGAYAWEPVLNGMLSERLSVTIDGMRIFGACTDRMDPVTSYVDVSGLSEVHIASGQQGAAYGSGIGGAIDLRLDKSGFGEEPWRMRFESGFETNNELKVIGAGLNLSGENYYMDGDIIYRKAENYVAGGGEEVRFSQYEKYNISVNGGYRFKKGNRLTATFIYDEAGNVGYPALPMDVSLARAVITSAGYEQADLDSLSQWESKIYYNTITHVMDDSQRPDVPVRMDMPGRSDTYGFYSAANLISGDHRFLFKWDGFYNKSLADMTMYPANPGEPSMYMLTWPDVRVHHTGVYAEDIITIKRGTVKLSARVAMQGNRIADRGGLNSLRIFYPGATQVQMYLLPAISAQYDGQWKALEFSAGLAYGSRAPSVSEGYGFYLFNSFDNHDYIGKPGLKIERSAEINAGIAVRRRGFSMGFEGNFFRMYNYIIGEIAPSLSPMTIGADGVKMYTNLEHADMVNLSLSGEYQVLPGLAWSGSVSWHRGTDHRGRDLPFISPLAFESSLKYRKKGLFGEVGLRAAGKQLHFNPEFGEDQTPAYTVFSMALGKTFDISGNRMHARTGMENIFNTYYSTYTDWNNIPRMGRNIFFTISYRVN